MYYLIYQVSITEAKHSIDGKKHRHKLYLYPIPKHLRDLGIRACWKRGKKGACIFYGKKLAQEIAKQVGGKLEAVKQ